MLFIIDKLAWADRHTQNEFSPRHPILNGRLPTQTHTQSSRLIWLIIMSGPLIINQFIKNIEFASGSVEIVNLLPEKGALFQSVQRRCKIC